MRRVSALVLGSGLVLGLAAAARADGIEMPAMACPRGARLTADHTGPYCEATTCADDATCTRHDEARACAEVPLCVEGASRQWMGRPAHAVVIALSECGADGSCARGRCERALRCVDEAPSSCACRAPGGRRTGPGALGVALGVLLALGLCAGRGRPAGQVSRALRRARARAA